MGTTLNCSEVDFCPKAGALSQEELTQRLGCCECSSEYGNGALCNPPPPGSCPCLGDEACDPGYTCDVGTGECKVPDCTPENAIEACPETGECVDGKCTLPTPRPAETCMVCHNGSQRNDYGGAGLANPHPFKNSDKLKCTTCHGGNGEGAGKEGSHVPPPPQIGDDNYQLNNPSAFFNRITLAGIDKFPNYTVDGQEYTFGDTTGNY